MKINHIYRLIAVSAITVIGLIAVQIYWVGKALRLKEDEFARQVYEVLNEVVATLEKEEAFNQIKHHTQGKYLLLSTDTSDEVLLDTNYDYLYIQEYTKKESQSTFSVTEINEGQINRKTSTKDIGAEDSLENPFTKDFNLKKAELGKYIIRDEKSFPDTLFSQSQNVKTAIVSDVVQSLMQIKINEPIDKRAPAQRVDSLLNYFLHVKGVNTVYDFGIYSAEDEYLYGSGKKHVGSRPVKSFAARLYPSDNIHKPFYLRVTFPRMASFMVQSSWAMLGSSFLIIIAVITIFYYNVKLIIQQKNNSEIKNDFINNMTHELKTPISTISLACEALNDKDMRAIPSVVDRYIQVIGEENKRLSKLVQEVLQSAVYEEGKFDLKQETVHLNDEVEEVLSHFKMLVKEKGASLSLNLEAQHDIISADRVHLRNVINNLVDNALKYSKTSPKLKISTENQGKFVVFTIKDNGIGISKENVKKIFDKLYRVPTGNVHDVKGFGLGLSYVNTVVGKMDGKIEVNSQLGKGSTFKIYLPTNEEI